MGLARIQQKQWRCSQVDYKKQIVIVGAGGFGREIAWLIERINANCPTWNFLGFVDDGVDVGTPINEYEVLGNTQWLLEQSEVTYCVCAIGNTTVRKKLVDKLSENQNLQFATLIDPSVNYSSTVSFGEGSMICAGNNITVNVTIGKHTIVNLDCTIGHDVNLGEYTTLYPSVNVSGMTTIGSGSEIGTGSSIIQGISIEKNTIVGASSVVVRDLKESGTYVGVPARILQSR